MTLFFFNLKCQHNDLCRDKEQISTLPLVGLISKQKKKVGFDEQIFCLQFNFLAKENTSTLLKKIILFLRTSENVK